MIKPQWRAQWDELDGKEEKYVLVPRRDVLKRKEYARIRVEIYTKELVIFGTRQKRAKRGLTLVNS